MTNDLIYNPTTKTDEICNYIIAFSDSIAKFIGISYSELWIGIMGIIMVLLNLYTLYIVFDLKKYVIFKMLFWIITIFIMFSNLFILNGILMFV